MSVAWGTAIGIALGLAYAASPLSVWCTLAGIALFAWAGRGLPERERRFVFAILAAGIAIRVDVIAALFLGSSHQTRVGFFWDGDGIYLKERALVLRNLWAGGAVSPGDVFHVFDMTYGWSSYLFVLAYLQYLTGPAPYAVHLFNVTTFVAAAVVMYRLVRSAYGRTPALVGLGLMLFLPTLVAWSVSALKESLFVFLFVAAVWGTITAIRAASMRDRVFGFLVLAGAVAASDTLRTGASLMMIAGLALGLAGRLIARRAVVGLLLLVCLPLGAARLWDHPRVQAAIMPRLRAAAVQHLGSVRTQGISYEVLDRRLYTERNGIATMTPDEGVRFALRAFASFVVAPLPWQIHSRTGLLFLPQQLIWYVLVALACVGFGAGLRRDPLLTCLLAGLSVATAAGVALHNGNIGTMVRFRDWIVPLVVWLSALGATAVASRIMSRPTTWLVR